MIKNLPEVLELGEVFTITVNELFIADIEGVVYIGARLF